MTLTYAQEKRQWTNQKTALTKAVRSGDPAKVIATTRKTVAQWEETGPWPDSWHRWNIALSDAYDVHRQQYIAGARSDKPVAADYDIDTIRRNA